jgi:hypothetical protein
MPPRIGQTPTEYEAKKKFERVMVPFCGSIFLYLGLHSVILFAIGMNNPSLLPSSTPCPLLHSSMMPSLYRFRPTLSLTNKPNSRCNLFMFSMQTFDSDEKYWNMKAIIQPSAALVITAEQRCFNGNTGTNLLFVNNQLVAFSTLNVIRTSDIVNYGAKGEIFDCHGQRLWRTSYDSRKSDDAQLRVYSDSGTLIYTSDFPENPRTSNETQLVYSQPDNVVCATISTDQQFNISQPLSPACDPRLLIMMYGRNLFFIVLMPSTCQLRNVLCMYGTVTIREPTTSSSSSSNLTGGGSTRRSLLAPSRRRTSSSSRSSSGGVLEPAGRWDNCNMFVCVSPNAPEFEYGHHNFDDFP